MKALKIHSYDEAKGKKVLAGTVIGDTFYRNVNSKHFMVKHHGYGISVDVLQQIFQLGVTYIQIDTEKGTKHFSKTQDWIANGDKVNYKHGEQVFLDIKYMEVT